MVNSNVIRVSSVDSTWISRLWLRVHVFCMFVRSVFNIQAAGLVVLAGTYVMYDRVYSASVIDGAKAKNTFLVGGNRGSLYNVSKLYSNGDDSL